MQCLRNNWMILGAAVGAYVLSWFFVLGFQFGNTSYFVWTVFKAVLPLIAIVCMYGLAIETAPARKRSKLVVHLTYPTIFILLLPVMWGGMMGSILADEPPAGAAVDVCCIFALGFGTVVFWFLRIMELLAKKVSSRHQVA